MILAGGYFRVSQGITYSERLNQYLSWQSGEPVVSSHHCLKHPLSGVPGTRPVPLRSRGFCSGLGMKLTDLAVAKAKPPASGRTEIWDAMLPGFGLRISVKGGKSWVVMYRV